VNQYSVIALLTHDLVTRRSRADRRANDDVHPPLSPVLQLVKDREELRKISLW
jgi:hypothetical protein